MKHWLVQSSGLRKTDATIRKLLSGLESMGNTWSDFGLIPFTTELTNWENIPAEPVFMHTSTKGVRILTEGTATPTEIFAGASEEQAQQLFDRCKAGIFYDTNRFDMAEYLPHLRRHMVNGNAKFVKLEELMSMKFSRPMFVKPTSDLKLFTGGILPADTLFSDYIEQQTIDGLFHKSMDSTALVGDLVELLAEYRFFVVAGKVVSWSQYRKFGKQAWVRDIPQYVVDAAKNMARIYSPARCFTMDLAITGNLELRIVEYNCINCSGHYEADIADLAFALRWA